MVYFNVTIKGNVVLDHLKGKKGNNRQSFKKLSHENFFFLTLVIIITRFNRFLNSIKGHNKKNLDKYFCLCLFKETWLRKFRSSRNP